jgi:hypothetical protein
MEFKLHEIALVALALIIPIGAFAVLLTPGALGAVLDVLFQPGWRELIFYGGAAICFGVLAFRLYRRMKPKPRAADATQPPGKPADPPAVTIAATFPMMVLRPLRSHMKPGAIIALAFAILLPMGVAVLVLSPGALRWTVEGLFALMRQPGGVGLVVISSLSLALIGLGLAVHSRRRARTDASDRMQ